MLLASQIIGTMCTFIFSEAPEKGEDCVENFFAMSHCMQENSEFYDELNARNKAAADEAQKRYGLNQ